MMRKIYITGAHSVGKTLLWRSLKNELEFENVKIIPFPDTGRIVAAENGYTHVSKTKFNEFGLKFYKSNAKSSIIRIKGCFHA